jgi:hypothetical protein
MRATHDYGLPGPYDSAADYGEPKGLGWVTFAAVMLGVAAVWNVIDGILAVSKSHVFAANAHYVFSDLNTWGWIVLILGIIEGLAAVALLSGREWARWFGIGVAGVSAIGQLMFVPAYPVWALAIFAVDIFIIYALAVYAGHRLQRV